MNRKTTKKVDESTLTTLCAVCRGAFLDAKGVRLHRADPRPVSYTHLDALKAHGVAVDIGIFMTLAFVSLPVIPKLRLNTYGIIDVAQQKVVPAAF